MTNEFFLRTYVNDLHTFLLLHQSEIGKKHFRLEMIWQAWVRTVGGSSDFTKIPGGGGGYRQLFFYKISNG
jgi:hypothetical protein